MKKIIFLAIISTILFACPNIQQNKDCSRYDYTFDISVSFEPKDSIIHIGDTITITSQFSNVLSSNETNELFLFDSVDFKTNNNFIKVDTIIHLFDRFDFLNDFEFIADSIYNFRKGNTTTAFDYYYNGHEYFLRFQFIPKVKGIYIFEFSSRINLTDRIKGKEIYTEDGECQTDNWNPNFITNNGNSYAELLESSPNEYYKEKSGYYFHPQRDGAHCFKVE